MNKKILMFCIVGMLLLTGVISVPALELESNDIGANAYVITVDDDRVECPDADYTTIQEAVYGAVWGTGRIDVYPGTYHENVVINDGDFTTEIYGIDAETTIIDGDGGPAITVENSWAFNIRGFTFTDSSIGVFIDDVKTPKGVTIKENIFTGNDIGVCIERDSWPDIYHNDFIDNTLHAVEYAEYINCQWDNGHSGNYWDNYIGWDTDKDGVGDIPRSIFGGGKDRHPLMKSYFSENQAPSKPTKLIGPTKGVANREYTFYAEGAADPDGKKVYYSFDVGYGEFRHLKTGLVSNGEGASIPIDWDYTYINGNKKTFSVRVRARDILDIGGEWCDETLEITIINYKPTKPSIPEIETKGGYNKPYTFKTSSSDPENDDLWYQWDWGNGKSEWLGPYISGESISTSHTWTSNNEYSVCVRSMNEYGAESDWSDPVTVTISKGKQVGKPLFLRMLGQFTFLTQILKIPQ